MKGHIRAILWKQIKDTVKNKTTLIQFLMFPCMTVIMENAVSIPNMPERFFVNLFGIMYVGMASFTSAAAVISEEKEKNTLRVMRMYNVGALGFLIGNALYIIGLCSLGSFVMGCVGGYREKDLLYFMLMMVLGHTISFLLGAAVGVWSKNQMTATALAVPLMMALAFLPMLSMFNETIGKIAKYIYSGQLFLLVGRLEQPQLGAENAVILFANAGIILGIFLFAYRKKF